MSSSLAPPALRQAHRHSSYGPGELGHLHPSLSLHAPPPMPIRRTSAGARPGRPTSQTFRPSPLAGPVLSYDSLLELASSPSMGRPQKSASADALSNTVPRRKSMLAAYTRLPVVVIGDAAYPGRSLGTGAESRPAAQRFASASSVSSASTSADSTLLTSVPPTPLLSARSSATSLSSRSSATSVHVRTSGNAAAKPTNANASASAEPKSLGNPPEVKHNWLAADPTPLFSRSALRTQGVVMPIRASGSASSTGSGSGSGARSVRSSRSVSSGETTREVLSVKGKGKEKDKEVVAAVTVEENEVERKVERSSRLARSRTLSTAPSANTGLSLRRRLTRAGNTAAGLAKESGEEQSRAATEGEEKGKRTRRMSLTWALGLAQGQVQRRRTTSAAAPPASTSIPVSVAPSPTPTPMFEEYRESDAGSAKTDAVIETEMEALSPSSSSSSSSSSSTSSMLVPAFASSSTSTSTSVTDVASPQPPTQPMKTAMTSPVKTTAQGSLRRAWKSLRISRSPSVRVCTNAGLVLTSGSNSESKLKSRSKSKPSPKLERGHDSDGNGAQGHERAYESRLERLELELGLGLELGVDLGLGPENGDKFEPGAPEGQAEAKVDREEMEKSQPVRVRVSRSRSFFAGLSLGLGLRSRAGAVRRRASGRSR